MCAYALTGQRSKMTPSSQVTTESTTLKQKAHKKLETWNAGTRAAQSSIMRALITSENKPRVMMLTGKASSLTTGLTTALITPSTIAITKVQSQESMATPGNSQAVIPTAKADNIKVTIIYVSFLWFTYA